MGAKRALASILQRAVLLRKVCFVVDWMMAGTDIPISLDGEVKLWDLRSHDGARDVWEMRPEGLEAFDVHLQTGVFGMYVTSSFFSCHRR